MVEKVSVRGLIRSAIKKSNNFSPTNIIDICLLQSLHTLERVKRILNRLTQVRGALEEQWLFRRSMVDACFLDQAVQRKGPPYYQNSLKQ